MIGSKIGAEGVGRGGLPSLFYLSCFCMSFMAAAIVVIGVTIIMIMIIPPLLPYAS